MHARIGVMQPEASGLAEGVRIEHDALRCVLVRMFPQEHVVAMLTPNPGERRVTTLPPNLLSPAFTRLREGLRPCDDLTTISEVLLVIQRCSARANKLVERHRKQYMVGIEVRA